MVALTFAFWYDESVEQVGVGRGSLDGGDQEFPAAPRGVRRLAIMFPSVKQVASA